MRRCENLDDPAVWKFSPSNLKIGVHYFIPDEEVIESTFNLHVAIRRVIEVKTQQYSGFWLSKRVARAKIKIESHISLTRQLASNNLADLKLNMKSIS